MTAQAANKPEKQAATPEPPEKQSEAPMFACPMAKMCMGMMEKPGSSVFPIIAGAVFIALGVLTILEPRVLIWIAAIVFVLIGVMMMAFAGFIRKGGGRFGGMGMHGKL